MSQGRFPSWNPVVEFESFPWLEAIIVTSKDRFTIPNTIRRLVPWLETMLPPYDLLADMDQAGHVIVLPWHINGEKVIAELSAELLGISKHRRAELLVSLQRRYVRLAIDKDFRAVGPPNFLAHLDWLAGRPFYALARDQQLEFVATSWLSEKFDDLPPAE
jgi:hypothetical protein